MEMAQLTSSGQITVPIPVRRKLGLREGSRLHFVERDDGFLVTGEADSGIFEMTEEEIQDAMKRGWSREYLENFLQFGKDPDPTFMEYSELPFTDRGELFE